jgi:large subunit ribosomal protein L11
MGTCVSLGCTIEGKDPREVQAEVDEGKYDSLFQE